MTTPTQDPRRLDARDIKLMVLFSSLSLLVMLAGVFVNLKQYGLPQWSSIAGGIVFILIGQHFKYRLSKRRDQRGPGGM